MDSSVVHVEEADGITRRINFSEQDSLKTYISDNVGQLNERTKIEIKKLELRKYQEELCVSAVEGHNVVICAPTGSGKTIVAVKIIQEHLRRRLKTSGKGKVVLLVPTVNLIDQQADVLNTYLGDEFKICVIKGGLNGSKNKLPKSVLLHDHHVSVMTPQIFVNMLSMVDGDEENDTNFSESKKAKLVSVSINDITMMIFDECHHTDKAHAYNEIMNFYYDEKYNNRNAPLPQVIGLTASLGVGQADNLQKAIDHIIKICAHLDVKKLAIIERYQAELERHVYAPKDEIIMVPSTHETHDLSRNIIALMKVIEAGMLPILQELEDIKIKTTNEVDKKAPEKRWSSQYTCWLFGWYHYAPKIINSERKRILRTLLQHCIIYHKSLEMNALTPTIFAIEYLKYEFNILERKQTSSLDKELLELYQSQKDKFNLIAGNAKDDRKQIVNQLKLLLLKEYEAKPDSRTLIFVRTRELALAVERFINEDSSLSFLNAGHLTGVNARKDSGGQTEREQQECLERFRKGEHKLMVATTVAEEGLDISKCNLVIKYNHVTNEIALVQRRGRGRAEGSKSILLTHEGWIQQKETVNLIRERLMKSAIEVIKTKSEAWLAEQVDLRAAQLRQEKDIEKQKLCMAKRKLGNKTYDILCKKCDAFICSSNSMRTILNNHYVSTEPQIWPRMCAEPNPKPLSFFELSVAGILSCFKCREDCGVIIKYRGVFLPALKAGSIVLREPNGTNKFTAKQWKQILTNYFVVDSIKNADLPPMFHALSFTDREKLDKCLERAQTIAERNELLKKQMDDEFIENGMKALRFIEGDMSEDAPITVAFDLVTVDA